MRARSEAKAAFDAQANDVERSRKAAEDSAIAAGRLADAAQKSLNITERSAKAAERSTRIADESRQVEQQILQNSIDTFRSEQRPWLMVDKTEPDYDKKLGMTVYLTNRGKTPAYRVRNEVSFEYGEASLGKDMNMQFARMGKEKFMSSIDPPPVLPDGHETYSLQLSGPVLQYVNKYSVRVVGLVTYFDLYEKEYHVNLCFEAHPTVRQIFLSPCMEQDANVSK
jgi:hypothetical protein